MRATSSTKLDWPREPAQRSTFVLVHGAFQTGAVWEYVAAELRRCGHAVCRILQVQGGHYVMVTRPRELAEALIQAGRD